jgi:hypothetical protein
MARVRHKCYCEVCSLLDNTCRWEERESDLHARLADAERTMREMDDVNKRDCARLAAAERRADQLALALEWRADRLAAIETAARAVIDRVGRCQLYGPADSAREALDALRDALAREKP